MKRKNNYCGTDGVYTFYCPKGRACLHKNASGCAPAKQVTEPVAKKASPPKPSATASATIQSATAPDRKPLESWETRTITQSIGKPWSANPSKLHTGLDIAAAYNDPVFPVTGGRVVKVGQLGCIDPKKTLGSCPARDQNWGAYVVVQRPDGTANGYLHLDPSRLPKVGANLPTDKPVGYIYRDHLHLNYCTSPVECQRGGVTPEDFKSGRYLTPVL